MGTVCNFSKGHTHPLPSGSPPTVGHVWGMLKGVLNVQTFNVTIGVFIEPLPARLSHFRLFLLPPTSPTAFSANINFRFSSLSWVKGSYPQTTQGGVLPWRIHLEDIRTNNILKFQRSAVIFSKFPGFRKKWCFNFCEQFINQVKYLHATFVSLSLRKKKHFSFNTFSR